MPELVVFDLDGTITRRDTLLPYAWRFTVTRKPWRLPLFLGVLPSVLRFLLRLSDEGQVKAAFIRCALGGSTRAQIEDFTASFVPRLLGQGLFAEAVRRIAAHRTAGDHLVLMSASADLYVPEIARQLGFAEAICTGVRWEGDRLEGSLTTPNRKGPEKVRCFLALRERHPGLTSVAYGNAAADLPQLRLANRGILVNGSASARAQASALGVVCVEWR